ncbi:MAG: hypothetical protein J6C24_04220 [Clostridia bacterium]|nr:hypothetical protein [Clostridia bacterium]
MKKTLLKNKWAFIALAGVLVMGTIGGTFAYFSNSTLFENIFEVPPYSVEYWEVFESPKDWQPGDTTSKDVYAKNTGGDSIVVRAKIDSQGWVNANGKELPLTQDNEVAAIINFTENSKWILSEDGYYYYNETLEPDEETADSFIDSVTFNAAIENDTVETTYYQVNNVETWISERELEDTDVITAKKVVIESTGEGYDGATYSLNIKIETLQATEGAIAEVWGDKVPAIAGVRAETVDND